MLFTNCKEDKVFKSLNGDQKTISESTVNAVITHTLNGRLKAKIFVGKMQKYKNNEDVIFMTKGVEILFYDKNLNLISRLSSQNAEINEKTQVMKADLDVILSDEKEKTLKCNTLHWDKENDLIFSDENVIIETKKEIIYGSGFKSTSKFRKYSIEKINGTLKLD